MQPFRIARILNFVIPSGLGRELEMDHIGEWVKNIPPIRFARDANPKEVPVQG